MMPSPGYGSGPKPVKKEQKATFPKTENKTEFNASTGITDDKAKTEAVTEQKQATESASNNVVVRREFGDDDNIIYDNIEKTDAQKKEFEVENNEPTQVEAKIQATEGDKPKEEEKQAEGEAETDEKKRKNTEIKTGVEEQPEEKKNYGLELFTGDHLKDLDVKTFLMSPVPKGKLVQCTIKRDKGGLMSHTKYILSLSNQPVFLMASKKQSGNKTSNYAICMNEKEISKKGPGYLGKVRANFVGTEFHIYDDGVNPTDAKPEEKVREELGAIKYESNVLGTNGPRKMMVLIPEAKPDGEVAHFKPTSDKESMLLSYAAKAKEGMTVCHNKTPKWNDKAKAYVLNFNGRVKKASVKNFQLSYEGNEDTVLLQFGRVDDSHFIMDLQWPMSPFQAFAICMTSFDSKIACE